MVVGEYILVVTVESQCYFRQISVKNVVVSAPEVLVFRLVSIETGHDVEIMLAGDAELVVTIDVGAVASCVGAAGINEGSCAHRRF